MQVGAIGIDQAGIFLRANESSEASSSSSLSCVEPVTTGRVVSSDMQETLLKLALKPWRIEFQWGLAATQPDLPVVARHVQLNILELSFELQTLTIEAHYDYIRKEGADAVLGLECGNIEILSIETASDNTYAISKGDRYHTLSIPLPEWAYEGRVTLKYRVHLANSSLHWSREEGTFYTPLCDQKNAELVPGHYSVDVPVTYELNVRTGNSELVVQSNVANNPSSKIMGGEYNGLKMERAVPLSHLYLYIGKNDGQRLEKNEWPTSVREVQRSPHFLHLQADQQKGERSLDSKEAALLYLLSGNMPTADFQGFFDAYQKVFETHVFYPNSFFAFFSQWNDSERAGHFSGLLPSIAGWLKELCPSYSQQKAIPPQIVLESSEPLQESPRAVFPSDVELHIPDDLRSPEMQNAFIALLFANRDQDRLQEIFGTLCKTQEGEDLAHTILNATQNPWPLALKNTLRQVVQASVTVIHE